MVIFFKAVISVQGAAIVNNRRPQTPVSLATPLCWGVAVMYFQVKAYVEWMQQKIQVFWVVIRCIDWSVF